MALIEQLLQQFPEDQRHLRFSFDQDVTGYTASALLALPTGSVFAQTDAPARDPRAAVDGIVDQLATEIRRHQQRLRWEQLESRKRRRERDFTAAEPHLSASRRQHHREAFFDVLRTLLRDLRDHARHELILAQLEGTIPCGELSVGDLLDEVILRAWDKWDGRPRHQPLDRWLVQLLHEILDAWGFKPPDKEKPKLRLHGSDAKDSRYAAADGWAADHNHAFADSLTRDDVLPAEDSRDPSETVEAAIQRELILEELSQFPRKQRRAFVLHVLDGWDIKDIAFAQDRSEEEVRADIEAVRRALQKRLDEAARSMPSPTANPQLTS